MCECVCVFPAALRLFFKREKKKKNLNTKERVKDTNVKAPGPLDDF